MEKFQVKALTQKPGRKNIMQIRALRPEYIWIRPHLFPTPSKKISDEAKNNHHLLTEQLDPFFRRFENVTYERKMTALLVFNTVAGMGGPAQIWKFQI